MGEVGGKKDFCQKITITTYSYDDWMLYDDGQKDSKSRAQYSTPHWTMEIPAVQSDW